MLQLPIEPEVFESMPDHSEDPGDPGVEGRRYGPTGGNAKVDSPEMLTHKITQLERLCVHEFEDIKISAKRNANYMRRAISGTDPDNPGLAIRMDRIEREGQRRDRNIQILWGLVVSISGSLIVAGITFAINKLIQ